MVISDAYVALARPKVGTPSPQSSPSVETLLNRLSYSHLELIVDQDDELKRSEEQEPNPTIEPAILATCSRLCVRGLLARGISRSIGQRSI